jgi:myo-inositol-1(or 4)-monophosphatase
LGAINLPVLEQFCSGDNRETTVNGKPVKMRETKELSQATLLTTDIQSISKYQRQSGFEKLAGEAKFFRTWGDCYGYFLAASGRADIMLDPVMSPWDVLALIPVIRGAGGVITTWQGEDAVKGNSSVAANQDLHPKVIKILNSFF